jgi:hypothetical protein
LVGQPLIGGTRYQLERLRCGLCGKVETAELPAEAGSDKYDVSVASAVAVMRYGQGLPWKRIEFLQQCAGIPFPASVQWQVVRDAARRGLNDAFHYLKWLAAQGNLVYNDDTTMRILELASKQRNNQPLRLGKVYRADGLAKRVGLSPERRLELHRRRSAPVMKELQQWLKQQLEERKVEPNSSLGEAIALMLKHWEKLTLFLRVAGAPLDRAMPSNGS